MPKKISIILSVLALLGIFLVFKLASYVNAVANRNSFPQTSPLGTPDNDSDHDGLPNQEEVVWGTDPFNPDTDGDGFKDGEETSSGHDPLKPSPDDVLETGNMTEELSTLIVSGMYAGVLGEDTDPEIFNEALAQINFKILQDSQTALTSLTAESYIKTSDNSKRSQEKYLTSLGMIIEDLWGELISEPRQISSALESFTGETLSAETKGFFDSKASFYQTKALAVASLSVPPSWTEIHQQILAGLKNLEINHRAIAKMDDDPIKGIVATGNLAQIYQDIRPLLTAMVKKVRDNDLDPPSGQLWNLIDTLTNGF